VTGTNPTKSDKHVRDALEITLRIWHPDQDPEVFSQRMQLQPSIAYRAGEPRRSPAGVPLGSVHRETLWAYDLKLEPNLSLAAAIEAMDQLISSRESLIRLLLTEGARLEYFVGIFLRDNQTEVLSPEILSDCAKRGITLILSMYSPQQSDSGP